jgi:hypothetical protein
LFQHGTVVKEGKGKKEEECQIFLLFPFSFLLELKGLCKTHWWALAGVFIPPLKCYTQ